MYYYVIVNGTQQGPYQIHQLQSLHITPTTMMWREGLPQWVPAAQIPELQPYIQYQQPYQQPGSQAQSEYPDFNNPKHGQQPNNDGQQGYNNGYNQQQGYNNGQQGYNNGYQQQGYNSGYQQQGFNNGQQGFNNGYNQGGYQPKNWLTLAIVSTVCGFLFSCVGLIFGLIAVSKANKANKAFAFGDWQTGEKYNSSAKTMTIIAFILAGIGLVGSVSILNSF